MRSPRDLAPRLPLCACALALGLALAQDPGESSAHEAWLAATEPDGRRIRLTDTSNNECLPCHEAVGEEWRHSTHASAWQDEHYQKELAGIRKKQQCWGCHVPGPLAAQGLPQHPEPRTENRHLGVDCIACHQDADGETILGPWGLATEAHPTRASELFDDDGDSALCVACHATSIGPVIGIAKDFIETDQPGLGLSCVGCHMPVIERPSANDPDGTAGEEGTGAAEDSGAARKYAVRRGRSHRLMTPRDSEFLRSAFLFEVERDGARTILRITNTTGHRVPGLMKRTLEFRAKLHDARDELVAQLEHTIDNRAFLPVEGELELVLEGVGTSLVLEGLHSAPGFKRPVRFLDRTFASQ